MAAKDEVINIIRELEQVGALIPEKEWADKCVLGHELMLNSSSEAKVIAFELLISHGERADLDKIDRLRPDINTLEGQGYLPPGTRDMLTDYLSDAVRAIQEDNYVLAASKLKTYSEVVENYLPQWTSQCACAKKGDIVSAVHRGLDDNKKIVAQSDLNAIWQDTIAALNRRGIVTSEEADRLIKEVRW